MSYYSETIDQLRAANNLRTIPEDSATDGLIDLSSNDYLGIGTDSELRRLFFSTLDELPAMSASASRLLAANQKEFSALESLLCDLYGRRVLLFNSGYHANTGIVSALARGRTLIVADKLVHASIIDGMILSKARFERFRHNDAGHLRQILERNAADYDRVLIICESIYSMDGDIAPLAEIADCKTANSLLYVDEAHAFGVMGRDGLGLAVDIPEVDILVGTMGKAIGSVGAFAAVSDFSLRDYLVNSARPFIFSTALPPINCAWSRFVIERLPDADMEARRRRLRELSRALGAILSTPAPTHIQPLIVGDSARAIALSGKLRRNGFKVLPIRTPTVPAGTERLRFSLSANLSTEQLLPLGNIIHS